ncbi:NAD(P)-binding protein [Trichoderma citrinoviride]|uniref:NAD(P)-binding protein n=1 Tax=Trichoderma citrinoviride TaxID=58853 RepID=A0A2T4B2Q8_9HYPO|nr:NAD(P)-binding protein [Trichoderma citrinoviride]PTB63613.1 NAD(P)-binding protein [Trichoderma citrinoviride]
MAEAVSSHRLLNRVCIVTGSSSGLGRAISLAYAREGAFLACVDLRPDARQEIEAERGIDTDALIRQKGGRAVYIKADVSLALEVEEMVKATVAEYGRIDVLVNNAGISIEAGKKALRIHETPEQWWDLTMAVNTKSVFLASKYVIAQMLSQDKLVSGDRGWIINLSSIYGLVGGKEIPCYAASKGAVTNLTRQIAMDYAKDGIHCNAICPGYTATAIFENTTRIHDAEEIGQRHPLHGIGMPEDITGAAVFLASSEARWITGAMLSVDGGYTAQ